MTSTKVSVDLSPERISALTQAHLCEEYKVKIGQEAQKRIGESLQFDQTPYANGAIHVADKNFSLRAMQH